MTIRSAISDLPYTLRSVPDRRAREAALGRDLWPWTDLICLILWQVPTWARGRWYVALCKWLTRRWWPAAPAPEDRPGDARRRCVR